MPVPVNSQWAINNLTNISGTVEGEGEVLYDNKIQPPSEIQTNGLLLGTALPFQWINYQFDMIYDNIEYLKAPLKTLTTESATTRTLGAGDHGKYIRFTNASAITYTFNEGVAELGAVIEIRQVGAGAVTISPGSGVTLTVPAGKAPKTSGAGTTIRAIKVIQGVGVETWDLDGELGT